MLFLESYKTMFYSLFTTMLDTRGSKGVKKSFPIEVTLYFAIGSFPRAGTGFIEPMITRVSRANYATGWIRAVERHLKARKQVVIII